MSPPAVRLYQATCFGAWEAIVVEVEVGGHLYEATVRSRGDVVEWGKRKEMRRLEGGGAP